MYREVLQDHCVGCSARGIKWYFSLAWESTSKRWRLAHLFSNESFCCGGALVLKVSCSYFPYCDVVQLSILDAACAQCVVYYVSWLSFSTPTKTAIPSAKSRSPSKTISLSSAQTYRDAVILSHNPIKPSPVNSSVLAHLHVLHVGT